MIGRLWKSDALLAERLGLDLESRDPAVVAGLTDGARDVVGAVTA